MNKKYNHIIPAVSHSMKIIDAESVDLVKTVAGKINQSGMRYPDAIENTVVLQSDTMHDIFDCVRNQAWAHSSNPSRVKKGWTVYVVPSNPVQKTYGTAAQGVRFIASEDVYTDMNNQFKWASE